MMTTYVTGDKKLQLHSDSAYRCDSDNYHVQLARMGKLDYYFK